MAKKTGLGQGVGLLFGEEQEKFFECDINDIIPNQHQPRTQFDANALQELADSIREQGIIQPLIVKPANPDGKHELIAGERRWRASQLIDLKTVPVVVTEVSGDDALLEMALIENIQRTDLTPIEEAEAYCKLIEKFGYTQEETAKRVGKNRTTVTNLLRLLKLPKSIQADVNNGLLSEGHARALIRLVDEPLKLNELREQIIKNGLSVRQTEKLIKRATPKTVRTPRITKHGDDLELPPSYRNAIITQLMNHLNRKVHIVQSGTRGKLEIEYYSTDDLDNLVNVLTGEV
jgi:ParB family chromosome partitioning protein